ncbi:MAG: cobyrinate a,c-diamide synthase [Alphaproteobacteria bacterium]
MSKGFLIAAPSSGQGKTLITFGLLKALRDKGLAPQPFKTGPDYIDPRFHERAANATCLNLDPWAMSPDRLHRLYGQNNKAQIRVVEGVMGLFDGAESKGPEPKEAESKGKNTSSAALAVELGLPVILVVDCKGMAQSLAALVHGFSTYNPHVNIAGLILNRVASPKHQRMLCADVKLPVFGCLPSVDGLKLESRHLGLKQAQELGNLDDIIDRASTWISTHIDLDQLVTLSDAKTQNQSPTNTNPIPPLGQHIAIASDTAFAFAYPHLLDDWRRQGAELSFFSPLENQAPDPTANAIYLPGGYPELYAEHLAANTVFLQGLQKAAAEQKWIYGECGGYMVLGQSLTDAKGVRHNMAGLLPVETSFANPKRQLGYRQFQLLQDTPIGKCGQVYRGHEFHFSSALTNSKTNLFSVTSATGETLGSLGHMQNTVFGSYLHLIDALG